MIMDACVLIDFLKTDASVLRLIAKHVGPVYVLNDVVQEVNQIETEEELTDLGLSVVEPTIDDAYVPRFLHCSSVIRHANLIAG